jgi:hypothetical protein
LKAPVHSGVIIQTDNGKRVRERPNLIWKESVKRHLKNRSIAKKLVLDRREWKLAIHMSER